MSLRQRFLRFVRIAQGCGCRIDPSVCGCGVARDEHSWGDNHSFVPIGCDCYRWACTERPESNQ